MIVGIGTDIIDTRRIEKVINKYGCIVDIYGVKELTANSLIECASSFHSISNDYLV